MSELCSRRLEAKDYWPHFKDAGALNAWAIDSGGDVERARSQAFKLEQGRYPCIEYPEVIGEQHEQGLSSFFKAIGSSNHINAADAAGSLNCGIWKLAKIGVGADYVRNAQSKARSQRRNLSQSRSYTYQYPKMIAKLGTAALDLTPECKARLQELRKSPNDLNQWRLFHEEFGLFVCPIVTFGGAIYSDRSLERVCEEESHQQEGSNNASGEAMFQSELFLGDSDMKISAHSKGGQSQGSSSTSRTANKAGIWRKIGGRNLDSNFQEWIEELKDLTTWRIIRRSKPVLLLDMIPGIPGMEWVRDFFQLPQHPIRPAVPRLLRSPHPQSHVALLLDMIPGISGMKWVRDFFQLPQHPIHPAVPRLSRSPHPQSHVATLDDTNGDVTLLLFQNSLNHLVLVTLGILNSLAETPIVEYQVAPGTPLAIGRNRSDSEIYVFFADESHHLRDMFYSIQQDRWYEGRLHQSKIRIHQESALLLLDSYLYCQDSEGNILRVEMSEDEWLNPLNLHTKESDPLQRAWMGTPLSGNCARYMDTSGIHTMVVLYYLSSQGKIVRGIDGFILQDQDQNCPGMENPRVSAWQESPWVNTEQEVTLYPDFSMAPDVPESKWATPPIVFRTAGDFLNMCWQSKENNARWVFHSQICQTAPGSHFSCLHSCYETAYIFFFSQDAKLEMIEIDPYTSEDAPYISHRTIVDESCGAKPWKRLIMNTSMASTESVVTEA